jgi:hypothetical protein
MLTVNQWYAEVDQGLWPLIATILLEAVLDRVPIRTLLEYRQTFTDLHYCKMHNIGNNSVKLSTIIKKRTMCCVATSKINYLHKD